MQIKIYKDGSIMRIGPIDDTVAALLRRELTYTKKRYVADPRERRKIGKRVVNTLVECFKVKEFGGERQVVTNTGYIKRVVAALQKDGHEVKVLRPRRKPKKANTFDTNWKAIDDFDLRHKQREVLEAIVANERGQVCWATGAGKSFMVPLICMLFPKARIVVTTKHTAVLEDLHKNLSRYLPSVGINYSKRKLLGRRVTCCSAGTLHHLDPEDVDLVIADEVHELATDKMVERFARFRFSRMLGLSANFQDRFDGADFELEGIFGPLITDMTYEEGVDHGMIVPIEVHWQDMRMDRNPAAGKTDVARNRHGIWRNEWRNAKIAENAAEYADAQILITVKTFDHACHLKKHLPNFTLVYASTDDKGDLIDRYISWGLIKEDEPVMTTQRLGELKSQFESGELKKVIATSVWNRGVNFKNLEVLIRADAGASVIDDTQIPGRLSRTTDDGEKTHGVLIDYMDQFDPTFKLRASKRKTTYKRKGWTQIEPEIKAKTQ